MQESQQPKEILDSNIHLNVKYNNHLDYMDAYERTEYFDNPYHRNYK